MTQQNRTKRETQSRSKVDDRPAVWTPPNKLDTPPAPEGYKFRWVRHQLLADDHTGNVLERTRQHYIPVKWDDECVKDWACEKFEEGRHEGVVRSGDLILMMVPAEVADQRNRYYAGQAKRMEAAVNQELMQNDHEAMPISNESKSRASRGKAAKFED